jgi:hypothetical protein
MMRLTTMSTGLLLLFAISGCSSSRQLQSVSLTPASADAQNFPNGQVPFVANGTFNNPPSPVTLTSKDVLWCVGGNTGECVGNANPGAKLDQNGVARDSDHSGRDAVVHHGESRLRSAA